LPRRSPDLAVAPEHLGPVLERAGRDIVLEITEHVQVADYERLMATLYALDLRIRIAVDDAGAGYSGLQHILAIRPQLIKLDISLVRSVDVDIARQALISGMAGFGRRMGALLVAEGVERQEESDMLRSLGVDLVQGYLVGRPARADTFSAEPARSDVPARSDLPALEAGRLTDPATA
jgi:EAL domain-containing protein (putative c-di-GMP-specific phosphodiesterase class I)